jgi:hypothetical protein
MRVSHVLALLLCTMPGATLAQQPAPQSVPTEKVIVTAPGLIPDAILHDFIRSYTAASPASGKVARWRTGICPIATGLPQTANKLITDRLWQVAAMVGAPVGAAESCKPNIDIVFTLKPQVLLNQVRTKTPVLLGYHDVAQEKDLATVTRPVQAWYTTQSVDLRGTTYVDDRLRNHGGFYYGNIFIPDARVTNVTGSHLGDGVSSELYHVIVIVDLPKVDGHTLGAIADYVAMLSLAQTQAFGVCQPVASITNLVSAPCDGTVQAKSITANDLAYLHGLYRIDPRKSFQEQQSDIAYEMKKGPEQR